MMDEKDLAKNHAAVIKMAKEKKVEEPVIFSVSALEELRGEHEKSGYVPLRDYIKKHITGKNSFRLKIDNLLQLIDTLNQKYNPAWKNDLLNITAIPHFRNQSMKHCKSI